MPTTLFCVLYLRDWDEEAGVTPEVAGVFPTYCEAQTFAQKNKRYFIRRSALTIRK